MARKQGRDEKGNIDWEGRADSRGRGNSTGADPRKTSDYDHFEKSRPKGRETGEGNPNK